MGERPLSWIFKTRNFFFLWGTAVWVKYSGATSVSANPVTLNKAMKPVLPSRYTTAFKLLLNYGYDRHLVNWKDLGYVFFIPKI